MSARLRHNVKMFGEGDRAMIFAHGFGCDQNMWRFVAPAFQDDYRIVLFDHIGAGRSDPRAYSRSRHSSLNGYADDVLDLYRELNLNGSVFVGHSVSALIGILAAIKEPRYFDRLVLVGPSPCYINDAASGYVGGFSKADIDDLLDFLDSNYLGWSTAMAPVIMGNPERPELAQELSNSFCRTDPDIAKRFARVTFLSDNRQDLKKLDIPSLILQCTDDVIAPESVGRYMHEQMPGSELVFLKATGHCPNLSAPDDTIAAIKAFLRDGNSI